ncbi:adenosylmethionine decarboxylase [Candidatus Dependentiae bacterium]|nr:adenosylmethionine decarboxylase [Candidatus Dependentiae bacterium]MBU4387681.1 adenosylmethionine decarboxylase [Candidatus Dependentiae bacterium]
MLNKNNYLGKHLLVEFWECNVPDDSAFWEKMLWNAAKAANSTPLKVAIQKFEPHGITGMIILAESHISAHTWPEKKYIAIDIFTCGAHTNPQAAMEYLKKELSPKRVESQFINRGKEE